MLSHTGEVWYRKQQPKKPLLCNVNLPDTSPKFLCTAPLRSFSNSTSLRVVHWQLKFQQFWKWTKFPPNCGSSHSKHVVTILCSWELADQHGFVIYRCREKFLWLVKDLRGELRSSSAQCRTKLIFGMWEKELWSHHWFSLLNVCFLKHFPVLWSVTMVSACVWNETRGMELDSCWDISTTAVMF